MYKAIEERITELDAELRALSLDIHGLLVVFCLVSIVAKVARADHPEIRFKEQ